MPILSINFGISTVRGVYLSDEGNVSDYSIDYSYQENLYSYFYSQKEFYSDFVEHFIKKLKVPKRELQIIAIGFPEIPTISYEYANTITTDKLFSQVEDYDLVSLSNNAVFTQNSYLSLDDTNKAVYGSTESNYLRNLSIYKNVFPSKPSDYNLMFSNVWNVVNSHRQNTREVILSDKPTLFLGDIFTIEQVDNEHFEKIAYLHILSLIINPGAFNIMVDKKNIFPNLLHIKNYRSDLSYIYDNFKPEFLGNLINSPGETTCLIETDLGTSQLLDVGPGKIVFIPLDTNNQARIVVKSTHLGSIERKVQGGVLGLIIDTRAKNDLKTYDHNQLQIDINVNLKSIGQVLAKI